MRRFSLSKTAGFPIRMNETLSSNKHTQKKILIIPKVTSRTSLTSLKTNKFYETQKKQVTSRTAYDYEPEDDNEEQENEEEAKLNNFISLTNRLNDNKPIAGVSRCRTSASVAPTTIGIKNGGRIEPMTSKFVSDFIFSESKDQYARVIQNAFRSYRNKTHLKRFVALRIKFNRRLEKLFFINWLLLKSKDIKKMRSLHRELKEVSLSLMFVQRGREFSSFGYYYISGAFFVPYGYTQSVMYNYIQLMYAESTHRIFHLWFTTANSMRQAREKNRQYHYTLKKQVSLRPLFSFFKNWSNYTKWRKLHLAQPEESTDFISINSKELSLEWKVKEAQLNAKSKRIKRANEHQRRSVLTRALKALFNRSLQIVAHNAIISESDAFKNLALMRLTHRGWTKYIEMRQHRRQVIHDCIRAWYDVVYNKSKIKHIVQFYVERESQFFIQKIINKWIKFKEMRKANNIIMSMNVQKNSSLMLEVLYFLKGQNDFAMHVKCFRQWLKYTRARHRWHEFSRWVQTEDRNLEFKHQVVGELIHIATNKIVGRIHTVNSIIPRKLGMCFELIQHVVVEQRKQQKEEIEAAKAGNLDVRKGEKRERVDYRNPKDLLIRAFLLTLNKRKKFEKYGTIIAKKEENQVMLHSREEIFTQICKNAKVFGKNMAYKELNDLPIVYSLRAHSNAQKLTDCIPGFTVENDITVIRPSKSVLELDNSPIIYFPDCVEVISKCIDQIKSAPPKITSTFSHEYEEANKQFSKKLRAPEMIGQKSSVVHGMMNMISGFTAQANALGKSQAIKNHAIESYQSGSPAMPLNNNNNINSTISNIFSRQNSSAFDNLALSSDFTCASIRSAIGEMTPLYDMINSINKFFTVFTRTSLKSFSPLNENSPELFRENTSQITKRKVRKHVGMLVTEIVNTKGKNQIIENVQSFAKNIVSTILTTHVELRDTKLENYCEELPFLEPPTLDTDENVMTRTRVWNCIKRKFPKIESTSTKPQLGSMANFGSMSGFGSMAKFSRNDLLSKNQTLFDTENITAKDAYIACLVLPYILDAASIADFLRDFILSSAGQPNATRW